MNKPVVRFAIAAAVIGAVALGLFDRVTPYRFGAVWAQEKNVEEKNKEEKKKEETGLGYTYRERIQTQPGLAAPSESTTTVRESPEYGSRRDLYQSGKLIQSRYVNYADGTTISFMHPFKTYRRENCPKGPPPAEQAIDPRAKIKRALAGEHKKLGRRAIGGMEAEGIEVQNPKGFGGNFRIDSVVVQFWSSVETGCLVLVEENVVGNGGAVRIKTTDDQFRWNVRFDPNEFKAKIPPGYQPVDERQPGQGGGAGVGGSSQGSVPRAAGTLKSRQKARR